MKETTLTRQQALERLLSLETEAAQLKKMLDEKVLSNSLLSEPIVGFPYYYMSEDENGKLEISEAFSDKKVEHINAFSTKEQAAAYLDAWETMLLLRRKEGSEESSDRRFQWMIELDLDTNKPIVIRRYVLNSKITRISCSFDSEEAAKKAIKSIGAERIVRMFNTLHGIK